MLNALSLIALMQQAPPNFAEYLSKPDGTFGFTRTKPAEGVEEIRLVSQTWRGIAWKHDLTIVRPTRSGAGDVALLVVTGDRVAQDMVDAKRLAESAEMPVATLFNVPNQPLWDLREDGLIAHSFSKFIESGEGDWPLLFPMTKSVLRAMDAIQSASPSIKRFVVTGLSKRGWTTWLVGASGDPRVAGIAPGLYDFLNIPIQLQSQLKQWGKYSEMLADYSERDLQSQASTPRGQQLVSMVDPYSYRAKILSPTLVIRGSNDPYWTVDSTSIYWGQLKQPKWLLTLPNVGHGSGDGAAYYATIGGFARACAGLLRMPALSARIERGTQGSWGQEFLVTFTSRPGSVEDTVWIATSQNRDFRLAEWKAAARSKAPGARALRAAIDQSPYVAIFGESRFLINGAEMVLSSPTRVFAKAKN
ncbi:MAG: PhoPQ-activated protein PqaA family protein [Fimbriimonadaceae bacterium]